MNKKQHHTRSMAQKQESSSLTKFDHKLRQEPSPSYIEQQQIKTDDEGEQIQGQMDNQQSNQIMLLMQQLLAKQDLLLDENKQLKKELASQQIFINNLSHAVEAIQEGSTTLCQSTLSTKPCSLSTTSQLPQSTPPTITNVETSLKEQAAKQLQSKRINQLLDSNPFTGSASQEVSDWIDDFSNKCDQVKLDDTQRLSVVIDLLKGNAKLWYDTHKDTIDNWITLKDKLTAYFKLVTGTDHFQLEQKLYNRQRQTDELAIDYCHNVLKLCSKVNKCMAEETRLKHLTKGLNAVAQLHMDLKSPDTTEEFLQALIKYDKWQEEKIQQQVTTAFDYRRNIRPRTVQQEQSSSIPRQQYNNASQQHQSYYPPYDSHSPQIRHNNSGKSYSGCWSCGGMDHNQYNCSKNY